MAGRSAPELSVCGTWRLTVAGSPVEVSAAVRTVLAAAALLGPQPRSRLRSLMFPSAPAPVAASRLRDALSRVRRETGDVLLVSLPTGQVALAPRVRADVHRLERAVRMLLDGEPDAADAVPRDPVVLPEWEADWVVAERESRRAALAGALRQYCGARLRAAAPEDALAAAEIGVRLDPLDERAVRWLVRAHLALGDLAPAARALEALATRLWDDLGVTAEPATLALLPGQALRVPRQHRAAS